MKQKINNNLINLIYKLSIDTLALYLVFYALALTAEIILPGLISTYISFLKLTFILILLLLFPQLLNWINKDNNSLNIQKNKLAKKTKNSVKSAATSDHAVYSFIIVLIAILILLTLLKFTWPEKIVITIISLGIIIYFQKIFIH